MSLGLVARADQGGIATQSYEIARHLMPDRILVVKLRDDDSRGTFDASRYEDLSPEVRIAGHVPTVDDCAWLCETGDVFSVENFYRDGMISVANRSHARLSVHANPELFDRVLRYATEQKQLRPLAPTDWMLHRMPEETRLLWMPVATDHVRYHARSDTPRRFLHVSAPAMADRNGTELLRKALDEYVGPRIEVYVSGPEAPHEPSTVGLNGHVRVLPLEDVADYWDRYTDDYDALIQPRRYGGLSLVMQEALAAGLPVICLDRHPEHSWPGTVRVPIVSVETLDMKGGAFEVAACRPEDLANAIAEHALGDPLPLSFAAGQHAQSISWETLMPAWREAFA